MDATVTRRRDFNWKKWLRALDRQGDGILAALAATWTGLPIVLWSVMLGAFAGVLVGGLDSATSPVAHTFGIWQSLGLTGAVVGAPTGAFAGLLMFLDYITTPSGVLAVLLNMAVGFVVGIVTLLVLGRFEDMTLRLRGYRELSRRERQLIDPIVDEILERMGISGARPTFYMSDATVPGAWTHMNSITLTRGLLGSYDRSENPPVPDMRISALTAILAHEISHWDAGDGVGARAVWACCWPLALASDIAFVLRRNRVLVTLGWVFLWPAWVSIHFLVKSALAAGMRKAEYAADARVAWLGEDFRLGLRTALDELEDWEAPRTGWESVIYATHPPIELRQQQLEPEVFAPHSVVIASPAGCSELTTSDPSLREAVRLRQFAEREGNEATLEERARDEIAAMLNWLRAVEAALARGEAIGIPNSVADIHTRIVNLERRLLVPVNRSSVVLESSTLGNLVILDPVVVDTARRAGLAGGGNRIPTAEAANAALWGWLHRVEAALQTGDPVVDESVETIQARIAQYGVTPLNLYVFEPWVTPTYKPVALAE